MAISFDSSAKGLEGTLSTLTYTHTTSAGTNKTMVLFPFMRDGDFIGTVTVGGNAATFITGSKINTRNSRFEYGYIIPGVAASSALSVVVTSSGGTPGRIECVSYVLNGAVQATVPDAVHLVTVSTANPFVMTMTTIADNCWIAAGVDTGTSGQGSATCVLLQDNTPTGAMILYDNSNVAPVHPAGSATLNIGNSGSGSDAGVMVSIAPFVSAVNSNFLALL